MPRISGDGLSTQWFESHQPINQPPVPSQIMHWTNVTILIVATVDASRENALRSLVEWRFIGNRLHFVMLLLTETVVSCVHHRHNIQHKLWITYLSHHWIRSKKNCGHSFEYVVMCTNHGSTNKLDPFPTMFHLPLANATRRAGNCHPTNPRRS